MYPRNLHTHTWRCKHALGEPLDYCQPALAAGLRVLGFSDHAPQPDDRWNHVHMESYEIDDYLEAIDIARKCYAGRLKVLSGFECEYRRDHHHYFADELRAKCDYLIGGAHWYPDPEHGEEWPCTFYDIRSPRDMRLFTNYTVEMISSGLFSFIAHPDVFAHSYFDWNADAEACCRDILQAAADCKVPLELNALGFRRPPVETPFGNRAPYPYLPFWELAAEYPVEVVCNSDAHQPEDIAGCLDQTWEIVQRFNLRESRLFMD